MPAGWEIWCQAAIVLPERMHWAHTRVFLRFPPGFRIRTVCKFGIQRLFVLLLA